MTPGRRVDRRLTGSWDRIFVLILFFILLAMAYRLGERGSEERNILLNTLESLHHEHCINCEGHIHDEAHYNTKAHIDAANKHEAEDTSGDIDVQL